MPVRLWVVLVALTLSSTKLAIAQEPAGATRDDAVQLSVHLQRDGTLDVAASNAPLDDVIRAVAEAAGIKVSALGTLPRSLVTVRFADTLPADVLQNLLVPAGISYVMTLRAQGFPSRVVMGLTRASAADSPDRLTPRREPSTRPEPRAGVVVFPKDEVANVLPKDAIADAPAATVHSSDPTEWPRDVEPVNFGPTVTLPATREELFQMVNGTPAVSLPVTVTPPGTQDPGQIQIRPVTPTATLTAASRTPGAPTSVKMPSATANPSTASVGPDPSMLQPPRTVAIPAPVVVQFPAP